MTMAQDVDGIIDEEKLEDSNSAIANDEENKDEDNKSDDDDSQSGDDKDKKQEDDVSDDDDEKSDEESEEELEEDEEEEYDDTPSRSVEKAKSFVTELATEGLKVFDEDGNIRKFEDVLPAAQYFASQLEPVKVIDKDGKPHEFLLIDDVEKKFPDGFEAKNNIEQLKFERAITKNENAFDTAIKTWNEAKGVYEQEVSQITQENQSNQSIANEYKAMAKEGLVPEPGDPKDPKFNESDAVKELDSILDWIDKKNTELKKKGLGQITSLYVAKQLMDQEDGKDKKEDEKKKDDIDKQRKKVASLSNAPEGGDKGNKKNIPVNQSMNTFIESILEEEDIR